jgi:hypothetical protein
MQVQGAKKYFCYTFKVESLFINVVFFKYSLFAMKTWSDRILCGEIPIEKYLAIHPWRAIQMTCHFETRRGQVPQLTNNAHRSKQVKVVIIERIRYCTLNLLRNNQRQHGEQCAWRKWFEYLWWGNMPFTIQKRKSLSSLLFALTTGVWFRFRDCFKGVWKKPSFQ